MGVGSLKQRMAISLVLFFLLSASLVSSYVHTARAAEPTYLKIVNPLTGDKSFSFTTSGKNVGDTFIVNITVINVTDLSCWEFALQWDLSLLEFAGVTVPSDTVFAGKSPIVAGPDTSVAGQVILGSAVGPGQTSFAGSGTLAQVELRIIQGVGVSPLSFIRINDYTFLLDSGLTPIPFTAVNGYYEYEAEQAHLNVVNPLTGDQSFNFTMVSKLVSDTFIVNITVANVVNMGDGQVALKWNSSLLEFVRVIYPSDFVFAGRNFIIGGPDTSTNGMVIFAAGVGPQQGFSGSGVFAQVELKIIQGIGECDLSFNRIGEDTFLQTVNLIPISFIPFNGHFSLSMLGDVNYDLAVNMKDVMLVVHSFNFFPNTLGWNPRFDLDDNGRIDMRDIVIVLLDFNKHV